MRKANSGRKRPASGVRWDEQNLQENEAIKATISKTKITEPKTPYHGPLGEEHMADVDLGMLQPLELDGGGGSHPPPAATTTGTGAGPQSQSPVEASTSAAAAGPSSSTAVTPSLGEASADVAAGAVGPSFPAATEMDLDVGADAGGVNRGSAGTAPSTAADAGPSSGGLVGDAGQGGAAGGDEQPPPQPQHVLNHHEGHAYHGHNHHAHFGGPSPAPLPASASGEMAGDGGASTAPEQEAPSGFSSDSDRRASFTGGSDGEYSEESRRAFEQRRRAHYNMRAALRQARLLLSEDGEGGGQRKEDSEESSQGGGDGAAGAGTAGSSGNGVTAGGNGDGSEDSEGGGDMVTAGTEGKGEAAATDCPMDDVGKEPAGAGAGEVGDPLDEE